MPAINYLTLLFFKNNSILAMCNFIYSTQLILLLIPTTSQFYRPNCVNPTLTSLSIFSVKLTFSHLSVFLKCSFSLSVSKKSTVAFFCTEPDLSFIRMNQADHFINRIGFKYSEVKKTSQLCKDDCDKYPSKG